MALCVYLIPVPARVLFSLKHRNDVFPKQRSDGSWNGHIQGKPIDGLYLCRQAEPLSVWEPCPEHIGAYPRIRLVGCRGLKTAKK